jgi:uncharacterized iron-regulated membrane protein
MKRVFLALVALLTLSVTLAASFYNFEQITVDATAGGKGFTAAKITPSNTPVMTSGSCRLRTAEISVLWVDPAVTAVTASVGQLVEPGDTIVISNREDLLNFRAIRTGASSGQLDCTYKAAN